MRRVAATLAAFAALAVAAASATASGGSTQAAWVATATHDLQQLHVRPEGSKARYSRDKFGPAWADVDHNHCNTRDDILRRDLKQVALAAGSACTVSKGTLHDPYTGATIHYVRGPKSSLVQIDHVVALGDAWVTGASRWSKAKRLHYANDPDVLLAVSGAPNEAKGDGDASEWLPRRSFACRYVAIQISIKTKYGLWVTSAEHDAMANVLASCSSAHA